MNAAFLAKIHALSDAQLKTIAFRLAIARPELFDQLLYTDSPYAIHYVYKFRDAEHSIYITESALREMQKNGPDRKVTCIRDLREVYNLGLKEAKDLAEVLAYNGFLPREWILHREVTNDAWIKQSFVHPIHVSQAALDNNLPPIDILNRSSNDPMMSPGISLGELLKDHFKKEDR